MGLITRMRKQTCVWWPLASVDSAGEEFDDFGQPVVTIPQELTVRWSDKNIEFVGADGTKQLSKSKVHLGEDVEIGGILMLGVLTDVDDTINPLDNNGAFEIKRFDKIPTFKANEFLRIAYL